MADSPSPQKPQTFERGLDILFALARADEPLTVADIHGLVGLPTSTVYRFLTVLRSYGLVEENDRGRYQVGAQALILGHAARKRLDLPRLLRPLMQELAQATGESVILAVMRWPFGICVERVESLHPVRLTLEPGTATGLHAGASCKVLLAFAPEDLRERYLHETPLHRYTDRTVTDPTRLREHLQEIRRQGHAASTDEVDPESSAVAVPILGPDGDLVAGLSIAGPTFRFDAARQAQALERLRQTVSSLVDAAPGFGAAAGRPS